MEEIKSCIIKYLLILLGWSLLMLHLQLPINLIDIIALTYGLPVVAGVITLILLNIFNELEMFHLELENSSENKNENFNEIVFLAMLLPIRNFGVVIGIFRGMITALFYYFK